MSGGRKNKCGKVRHSCMKKAEVAMKALREKNEREGRKSPPMSAYYCVWCRSYHHGRLNKEKAKEFRRNTP
jgi:hypothetical protein